MPMLTSSLPFTTSPPTFPERLYTDGTHEISLLCPRFCLQFVSGFSFVNGSYSPSLVRSGMNHQPKPKLLSMPSESTTPASVALPPSPTFAPLSTDVSEPKQVAPSIPRRHRLYHRHPHPRPQVLSTSMRSCQRPPLAYHCFTNLHSFLGDLPCNSNSKPPPCSNSIPPTPP
jgi:hypothetical protein